MIFELWILSLYLRNKAFDTMSPKQPTSVAVLMINAQGMLITVQGQDYFLSYNRVPWLRDARISSVLNVRMSGPRAIEWPDLEIESLRHPERYPFVIKRSPLDVV